MSHPHALFRSFSSLALLVGIPCLTLPVAPAPAVSTGIQYSGEAFGSSADVAGTVTSGPSFPVWLGSCGVLHPPVTRANTGATVNARPYVATGVTDNTVAATEVDEVRTSSATSTVHSVSVLSGLVTADEIRAVSATSHDSAGFHTSGAGSRAVRLVVAGVPVLVQPGPNTRIDVAGIGHVVLNEQIPRLTANSATLVVNMIHVFVTQPNPLVPVGTDVIVGHAKSKLTSTNITGTLGGHAYSTFLQQGTLLVSGRSALVSLGCLGTNGNVQSNSIVSTDVQPAASTGTGLNTAWGVVSSSSASGETTSTVQAVDLLSSLVTADLVKADAHAFTDGSTFTFTDTGTSFANLSVQGFPQIDDSVPPNTRLFLAGLGTLWLRRELFTPNGIEIRMIELIVKQANVYGIPVGTVEIGRAHV